jgi:DNA-binding response OmpR family regulator
MRIILVEDNARLSALTTDALRAAGFAVDPVQSAADAETSLRGAAYDCVILDLGLPDGDGMDLLSALRRNGLPTPVLLVTARDKASSVVDGLNSGADDYMRKPFNMDELVARVRALLRRPGAAFGITLQERNIVLDLAARQATVGSVTLDLSRREAGVLEMLMRYPGRVISKPSLEDALYGFGDEVSSNAIEVLIHRLRKKLAGAGAEIGIHTMRGIGYLLSERRS